MDSGCVRGMNWETGGGLCILPRVKQIASGNLLYKHRELNSVLCDYRWDGGGESEAQDGGDVCIHMTDPIVVWQKLTNTLKQLYPNFFKLYIYISPNSWTFLPWKEGCLLCFLPWFLVSFSLRQPIEDNRNVSVFDFRGQIIKRCASSTLFTEQHITRLSCQVRSPTILKLLHSKGHL